MTKYINTTLFPRTHNIFEIFLYNLYTNLFLQKLDNLNKQCKQTHYYPTFHIILQLIITPISTQYFTK